MAVISTLILWFFMFGGIAAASDVDQEAKISCLASGPQIMSICQEELDVIQETIDFSQRFRSSSDTIESIVTQLGAASLPSQSCCAVSRAFNAQRCHCLLVSTGLLGEVGVESLALESTLKVMESACLGEFKYQMCPK